MAGKKATEDDLDAKRAEIQSLREEVEATRDARVAAEVASQRKVESAQLDSEIERLKAELAQESNYLSLTKNQEPAKIVTPGSVSDADNKNKEA